MSDFSDTDSEAKLGAEEEEEEVDLVVKKNIQPLVLNDHEEEEKIRKYESQKMVIDVNKLMKEINTPTYSDVTPMVNSKIPFLIDGDALIMYAFLQDNHEIMLGGQFLHVVYFCERFLHSLLDKGGNFVIVFFSTWEEVWKNNSFIKCLRFSVYTHFKNHSNYSIAQFPSFNCVDFDCFLGLTNPRCVLLDLSYHLSLETLNKCMLLSTKLSVDVRKALILICAEILFFRAKDLPCIDLCEININESLILSFNLSARRDLIQLSRIFCRMLNEVVAHDNLPVSNVTVVNCDYSGFDARRAIVVIASSKFLSSSKDVNFLKLILLCYASLEVLQLEHRCCPIVKFKNDSFADVQDKIANWMDCILYAFKYCVQHQVSLLWNNIADIWQATMFSYICYVVQDKISSGAELGNFKEAYEQYVQYVQHESKETIEAYPILPDSLANNGKLKKIEKNKAEKVNLHLLNNTLIKRYCGDTIQDGKWQNPPCSIKAEEFDEIRHWHCNKPLTDDYDRVKENFLWNKNPKDAKYIKKWKQKQIAQYAQYLTIYGNNLEGNSVKSEAIVPAGKNNDSTLTSKKQSKKSLQMQQEIKNDRDRTTLAKENKEIEQLKANIGKEKNIENKLCHIRKALKRLTKEESILKTELIMLRVYRDYINNGLTNEDSIPKIKEIFLAVKKVLEENNKIKEKDRIFLSKLLHQLGFDEIARRNNLPTNVRCKKILDLNWVRFQLQHLGPDMKRIAHGAYDPDVGFTPDPWQAEFISAIRENKSALVVAPTSSGKTFAAYYCMKRVLKESKDGVVVYVAPTKALVNQVEATIYSRFKNTNLPDGKAVVGVFTRDYKNNTLNSRILVTVPQCFEILLLSPRRYTWLKNLKYAIFDEVHKLTGSEEGLIWERCMLLIRCPFLALSATISDVPNFYNWLVSSENYKQEQDRLYGKMRKSYEVVLVEHTERHSDLIKYVYDVTTNLQHYHPYCALDSKTLKEHNGIPATLHLSPKEVWQLFDVMYSNENIRSRFTKEYNIYQFFSCTSESGFITRNDVTMYEKILARMFYEIYEENEGIVRDIIKELSSTKQPSMIAKLDDIPKLLNCMAERNLLPCIVFSYNRNLIEHANLLMIRESKNEVKKNENQLQGIDNDARARRKQKAEDKRLKMEKKERERQEGNNDGEATSRTIESSIILKKTGSKFKGIGIADAMDVQWLEKRLAKSNSDPNFVEGLAYGIAYHHGGLNNRQRSTAEILFRMGLVKVVFATGTLALGIHMPCKSIVIFGDSPYLNSIEYHQMSGRAGRRGFDTEGNVIFMGLTKNRQDMLMTERLPKMIGNFPINVTLVARLLLLVTRVTDGNRSSEDVTNITISRALALLENSLIFRFKPDLKIQIKYFVDFAAQLLFIQGIYSAEGVPLKLAGLVNHLHYHEPANLAFAYLFRCGALRQLILSTKDSEDAEWAMIIVLSHLFARLKLHKVHLEREFTNSIVVLEPPPKIILKNMQNYNRQVESVFNEYFISVAQHLADTDDTLPVSGIRIAPLFNYETEEEPGTISAKIKTACVKRIACSNFVAISGNDDTNLYTGSIISNIKHKVCPGIKVVPLLDTNVVYNSYAADFYRHGIVKAIRDDNGLKAGSEFTLLKDFNLVLMAIVTCLEEMVPANQPDPVYDVFKRVSTLFNEKFRRAFYV